MRRAAQTSHAESSIETQLAAGKGYPQHPSIGPFTVLAEGPTMAAALASARGLVLDLGGARAMGGKGSRENNGYDVRMFEAGFTGPKHKQSD